MPRWQRFVSITLPGVAYVAMIMVVLHVLFTMIARKAQVL
jgi:ABC-type sugar transport system permease subunit